MKELTEAHLGQLKTHDAVLAFQSELQACRPDGNHNGYDF